MTQATKSNPQLANAQPDLVDRIFEYIFSDPVLAAAVKAQAEADKQSIPRLKAAVRSEFEGEKCYITGRTNSDRQERVQKVLALFNGRNATEVARRLDVSRATVYRDIKQSMGKKQSHDS